MGKYEHDVSDQFESDLVNYLNHSYQNYSSDVISAGNHVKENIDYSEAHWIGTNTLKARGDIQLDDDKFLEVKYVSNGNGTRANISQNAITDYSLVDCISWSEFREQNNWKEFVIEKFSQVEFAPNFTTDKSIYDFARTIRSYHKSIQQEIMEADRQLKIEYIDVIRSSEQNHDNCKKFYLNLVSGNSSKYKYDESIEQPCENYYFLKMVKNGQPSIIKPNVPDSKFHLTFENDKTYFNLCSGNQKLLRIALHWKNKFQGIQTPCLNIFDV